MDGVDVSVIHPDLTAEPGLDLSKVVPLTENAGAWAYGSQEKGNFAISIETVVDFLLAPNPNGKPNSDVVRRSVNAKQIAQRRESTWVIDFGLDVSESEASLYEKPYAIVQQQVAPARLAGKDKSQAKRWWLHARPSPKYRAALRSLTRVIATPCVSKHRIFVFLSPHELADHGLAVIARSDDTTFGILHSRFHELWSLRLGTSLEDRPRYTPTTTFETFPFPEGLTPRDTANPLDKGGGEQGEPGDSTDAGNPPQPPFIKGGATYLALDKGGAAEQIAAAAKKLNALREAWLNPPEWVDWVITPEEEKAGFPKRPVAKPRPHPNPLPEGEGAKAESNPTYEADLKKRTLTNLYNTRPAWLDLAHRALDQAVAAAYGWADYTPDMPDDEILRRLLALNLQRAARG